MTEAEITQLHAKNRTLYQTQPLRIEDYPHLQPPTFERHMLVSDIHYSNYVHREYNIVTGKWDSDVMQEHDPKAVAVMERFMDEWQPTHLWYLGDIINFGQVSSFEKEAEDEEGIDEDVQGVRAMFARHRLIVPNARRVWTLGNHEDRLYRYMRSQARALRRVGALTFQEWFGLQRESITMFPYRVRVPILKGLLECTHGDKVAQKSGYTANKMLDKGVSGVSGHVHRLGMVYRTTRVGTQVWAENGCLCSLSPSYGQDMDWQQGFTTVYVDRANGRFHMEQLPIINGRIVHAGRVYEAA